MTNLVIHHLQKTPSMIASFREVPCEDLLHRYGAYLRCKCMIDLDAVNWAEVKEWLIINNNKGIYGYED